MFLQIDLIHDLITDIGDNVLTDRVQLIQDDRVICHSVGQGKFNTFNVVAVRNLVNVFNVITFTSKDAFVEVKVNFVNSSFGDHSREKISDNNIKLRIVCL